MSADFISRNDGEHVRGTECDQTILSKKGSSGVVYSPNYPFPYIPGISCRYFIYGLQDAQHFERVKLDFEKFDIPTTDYTSVVCPLFISFIRELFGVVMGPGPKVQSALAQPINDLIGSSAV